jgi:hypothetical protein
VLAAIQHSLPDNSEPNSTPQTAPNLIPAGPGGALVPTIGVFTAKSSASDRDYWKFRVTEVSTVTVTVEWYPRLGPLTVTLETDDPVRGIEELTRTGDVHSGKQTLSGILSPAHYRVRIGGSAATAYRLLVDVNAANLPSDAFEINDSFETAAHLIFEPRPFLTPHRTEWGPGSFDATLHRNCPSSGVLGTINDDYFELEVPDASTVFHIPEVSIEDTDIPLDVTLYDAGRTVIPPKWTGVRTVSIHPPGRSTCYLQVTAAGVSRYRIVTRITYDKNAVPGPQQRPFEVIPDWWLGPDAVLIREPEHHAIVQVHTRPGDGDALVFEHSGHGVAIELLGRTGEVIRRGEGVDGRLSIDTTDVEPGPYVMRVTREEGTLGAPVRLSRVPPLR